MGSHRSAAVALAALLFSISNLSIPDAWADGSLPPLTSVVYVSGLTLPVDFVQDPMDDARQFVVEQQGRIRVVYNGTLLPTPFLNLSASISCCGERGLLGLAFAPDYAASRRVFVSFTDPAGNSVVARFLRNAADPSTADPASRFDFRWGGPGGQRFITQPYANHNGGHLELGPDGYMYFGLGDGGSGGDPQNRAQNPMTLLGKMLRIDVNVPDTDLEGYAIPPANPFAGGGGPVTALPEIWAFGLRNPWQFSFDAATGALIIGDVGQGAWEEIDYQAAGRGGLNYGWRNDEGSHLYDNSVPPAYGPLTFPIVEYNHSTGHAVTGGVICRTCNLRSPYEGRYFYADSSDGRVWSVRLSTDASGNVTASDQLEHTAELSGGGLFAGSVTAMAIADPNHNLYLALYDKGTIVRVQSGAPSRTLRYGTRLSGSFGPDIALYRPGSGEWFVSVSGPAAASTWGVRGDIPVSGSYALRDTNNSLDRVVVFRPSTGAWYIPDLPAITWGAPGDIPVPASYSGSGFKDIAVYRPSTGMWYIRDGLAAAWGLPGDVPVPTDYDGNGSDDIAVYRPSNGTWYVRGGATIQWGLPGDIPVPADYDNDGVADYAVFRPSTGQWLVRGKLNVTWGGAGDIPVPLDLDQDGRAELIVYRPSTATWYVRNIVTGGTQTLQYGRPGDVPLGRIAMMPPWRPGDGDGDLRADLTVFRPSTSEWISALSSTGFTTYTRRAFGLSTDTPAARDYDGDGRQDPAVFRPSAGAWYVLPSSTGYSAYTTFLWGASGDIAVPADYDGDGRADVAVFRPSLGRWYLSMSATGTATIDWGLSGDVPVPADYDGDGRADLAVFRPSTGRWYILDRFSGAYVVRDWGLSGDEPAPADFDGDRRADLAVYRPSEGRWHILASSDASYARIDWGLADDVPMPLDYDGDGRADVAVYRPSTGQWFVRGLFEMTWGLPGDIPVPKGP